MHICRYIDNRKDTAYLLPSKDCDLEVSVSYIRRSTSIICINFRFIFTGYLKNLYSFILENALQPLKINTYREKIRWMTLV